MTDDLLDFEDSKPSSQSTQVHIAPHSFSESLTDPLHKNNDPDIERILLSSFFPLNVQPPTSPFLDIAGGDDGTGSSLTLNRKGRTGGGAANGLPPPPQATQQRPAPLISPPVRS